MTKKKIKRYSEAFKRQVVGEYESGCNVNELQKKYGITGAMTISNWIKKYAKQAIHYYNTDRPHLSLNMAVPGDIYYGVDHDISPVLIPESDLCIP